MFSHVMVGTNDVNKAKSFYDALLGTLGVAPGFVDRHRVFYMSPTGVFAVSEPINGEPATCANGAKSIEDPPGLRESNLGPMHLAYIRDPDGNKLCAMHRPG